MIEFRDVAVCYAPDERYPTNALEGVNLKIERGEWVFLVGPSGAGKSTLLKLLYGAAPALEGQVFIQGRDVTKMSPRDIPFLRRRIGVIFQDFLLMPQKTVWENVAFALQVIGTPQKQLAREVPRALETVGLHHKATMRPGQLSGGEQQRVAIARAIVNRPSLLLADEPTGNLDPATGADIIEVLKKVNAEGTTIVMATHDRAVVDSLRRRVVRLAEGRVQSDEAHGRYHVEDGVLHQPRSASAPPVNASSGASSSTSEASTASASTSSTSVPAPTAAPANPAIEPTNGSHEANREVNGGANGGANGAPSGHAPRTPWRPRAASSLSADSSPASISAAPVSAAPEPAAPAASADEAPLAPLGSPENPLVQFDRPAARPRRAGTDGER